MFIGLIFKIQLLSLIVYMTKKKDEDKKNGDDCVGIEGCEDELCTNSESKCEKNIISVI